MLVNDLLGKTHSDAAALWLRGGKGKENSVLDCGRNSRTRIGHNDGGAGAYSAGDVEKNG